MDTGLAKKSRAAHAAAPPDRRRRARTNTRIAVAESASRRRAPKTGMGVVPIFRAAASAATQIPAQSGE